VLESLAVGSHLAVDPPHVPHQPLDVGGRPRLREA
jgi:hypothetical protein